MKLTQTQIASICHETNRAYCATLGDTSQLGWDDAPEWQRKSAVTGVLFSLTYPQASAQASHDEWMKLKAAEGWGYGPVKDVEKKQHPCFTAYTDLPLPQRIKDSLFQAVVAALAPLVASEDDDFADVTLGAPACNLDGDACESCQ
jgi:hypothetical protein